MSTKNGLEGRRVTIVADDGLERVELTGPRQAGRQWSQDEHRIARGRQGQGWKRGLCGGRARARDLPRPMGDNRSRGDSGRRIASWSSLKTDLKNAGAEWLDQEVVTDGNLVSGRIPDDIPTLDKGMLELFGNAGMQAHSAAL